MLCFLLFRKHFTSLSDVISHLSEHSAGELNPDIKSCTRCGQSLNDQHQLLQHKCELDEFEPYLMTLETTNKSNELDYKDGNKSFQKK